MQKKLISFIAILALGVILAGCTTQKNKVIYPETTTGNVTSWNTTNNNIIVSKNDWNLYSQFSGEISKDNYKNNSIWLSFLTTPLTIRDSRTGESLQNIFVGSNGGSGTRYAELLSLEDDQKILWDIIINIFPNSLSNCEEFDLFNYTVSNTSKLTTNNIVVKSYIRPSETKEAKWWRKNVYTLCYKPKGKQLVNIVIQGQPSSVEKIYNIIVKNIIIN